MSVRAAWNVRCVKEPEKGPWNQSVAALHCRFLSKGVKCISTVRTKGPSITAPLRLRREDQSDMKNLRELYWFCGVRQR